MFKPSTVKAWMQVNLEEFEDRRTGEINTTALAEAAAAEFDQDRDGGPLDDSNHWIWDAAVDVAAGR